MARLGDATFEQHLVEREHSHTLQLRELAGLGRTVLPVRGMRFIGFEREDEAEQWARRQLQIDAPPTLFRALSSVDAQDEFLCVVVMTNFSARNIDMNIVISHKTALQPRGMVEMFNGVFGYAFEKLKVARVTGLLRGKNVESRRITEHFGFKAEGVMRRAFEDNDDLHIYGFLADEYRNHKWYRGYHG